MLAHELAFCSDAPREPQEQASTGHSPSSQGGAARIHSKMPRPTVFKSEPNKPTRIATTNTN